MAKYTSFNGTNQLRSKSAFYEKLKYEVGLFDPNEYDQNYISQGVTNTEVDQNALPKPIKKFFGGEYQFYGKVNEQLQPVYAKKEKLKLVNNKESIFALDFVAKKFADLKQNFVKCTTIGTISKEDPYLSVLKPIKGFVSVEEEYKNYINDILTSINQNYLVTTRKINNITKFEDYIMTLIQYSKSTSRTIPLTKSSFLKTNFCPMNVSGLVIELAELPYSDDTTKYNFTTSPNFKFFQNACIKHGFSIDYNAPWRIIADIDSPPMIEMMETMGYDRTTIFTTHFNDSSTLEVENIKKVLYNGYSNLVRSRPNIFNTKECKTRVTTESVPRKQISIKNANEIIDDQVAINMYILIRSNEQENTFSNSALENLNKNAFSYLKALGIEKTIQYVEQQMFPKQLAGTGTINSFVINYKKNQQRV